MSRFFKHFVLRSGNAYTRLGTQPLPRREERSVPSFEASACTSQSRHTRTTARRRGERNVDLGTRLRPNLGTKKKKNTHTHTHTHPLPLTIFMGQPVSAVDAEQEKQHTHTHTETGPPDWCESIPSNLHVPQPQAAASRAACNPRLQNTREPPTQKRARRRRKKQGDGKGPAAAQ